MNTPVDDSLVALIGLLSFVLAVAAYVWAALALSAMFRKMGEASWKGWVPLLNIGTVLKWGGFSPWLVLLVLIPVVGAIAVFVLLVISAHNINPGFGYGGGMTVLAALLFVVWASILGFGPARWLGARVASRTFGRTGSGGRAGSRSGAGSGSGSGAGAGSGDGSPEPVAQLRESAMWELGAAPAADAGPQAGAGAGVGVGDGLPGAGVGFDAGAGAGLSGAGVGASTGLSGAGAGTGLPSAGVGAGSAADDAAGAAAVAAPIRSAAEAGFAPPATGEAYWTPPETAPRPATAAVDAAAGVVAGAGATGGAGAGVAAGGAAGTGAAAGSAAPGGAAGPAVDAVTPSERESGTPADADAAQASVFPAPTPAPALRSTRPAPIDPDADRTSDAAWPSEVDDVSAVHPSPYPPSSAAGRPYVGPTVSDEGPIDFVPGRRSGAGPATPAVSVTRVPAAPAEAASRGGAAVAPAEPAEAAAGAAAVGTAGAAAAATSRTAAPLASAAAGLPAVVEESTQPERATSGVPVSARNLPAPQSTAQQPTAPQPTTAQLPVAAASAGASDADSAVSPAPAQPLRARRTYDAEDPDAFPEMSGEVSAVIGAPIAGAPRAAAAAVSAQHRRADEGERPLAAAPAARPAVDAADDDLMDVTIIARRSIRAAWELVPASGSPIPLTAAVVILGRRPSADPAFPVAQLVPVKDDARTVSKTHARLEQRGEAWVVTDLGSTNGVLVRTLMGDEVEVEPGGQLDAGERFFLGDEEFHLRRIEH